jgi:hypothetical protein
MKTRITIEQKREFYRLTMDPDGPRLPLERAAAEVGISQASAYRLTKATSR